MMGTLSMWVRSDDVARSVRGDLGDRRPRRVYRDHARGSGVDGVHPDHDR